MKRMWAFIVLAGLCALAVGCGGNSSSSGSNNGSGTQNEALFITGEDAPVSSVVGFDVTIDSITLNNGTTTVNALSTPTAVDFGRLMGLRTLLGFNTIPQGTYNSVTFTFENSNPAPSISYINLNTVPPSANTLTGSFSQTTVTVPFPNAKPLVVGTSGLAGLHIDFDLRDSLVTDNSGQITGVINPVLTVMAVSATDAVGQITEYTGNIVSVNTSGNSFVMQGPYGFQTTINVNAKTLYNGTNTLNSLVTDSIVSVIGTVQADGSLLANCVEQITTDKAFISGRVLAVNPTSGPVQSVTMWVGEELGTSSIIPVDMVTTLNLNGVSNYDVCFFDNFLTQQVFNESSLVVGQRIFVGGTVTNGTFTPDMVSLRRQGVVGQLVSGSVTVTGGAGSNLGYYQMQNDALMSYSAGGPFTVYTTNLTTFENIDGLSGLASAGTPHLISRGLVFKDPVSSKPVVVAGHVRVLLAQQ